MIEEMNARHKEMLAKMERMVNTSQTDVKLKELTETTSADIKACQDAVEANLKKNGAKSRRKGGRSGAAGNS
jgi:hypothetical protein